MEQKRYIIYKHTCTITDKSYIGITTNLTKRTQKHRHKSSSCVVFRQAIQKYSWDNFTTTILFETLNKDVAKQKEKELIQYYNALSPLGYNIMTGGQLSQRTQEVQDKITKANTGQKRSEESLKLIRANAQLRIGIPRSKDTIEKMRQSRMKTRNIKWIITNIVTGDIEYSTSLLDWCNRNGYNYNTLYRYYTNRKIYNNLLVTKECLLVNTP